MIIRRMTKKVPSLSGMILQMNHPFLNLVSIEKPFSVTFPCFVPVNIRCFCTSRYTHTPKVSPMETTEPLTSLKASRISRVARTKAQEALFDYLHSSRSFHFTDAEHISRNSPYFLQKLLSMVEHDEDVTRSLSRFFRYNPINEFEPFLESLGLAPSEFFSILPRDLMYLSDDHLMLDNFHVLCDYGIPRSRIGKIYKEAKEVFKHDFEILALKLRAYEKLGLSKSTVIKIVSCCPSLLIGGVNREFVRLLEKLRGLHVKNDWIDGYLTSGSVCNWKRMLDTMEFLENVGYSHENMRLLFMTNPALLFDGSGKKIYVMVGWLHYRGDIAVFVFYFLFFIYV